jgi:ABC-type transporter Mla maintaining outer membrane lipid asymmetry ATPase subunit MlaF
MDTASPQRIAPVLRMEQVAVGALQDPATVLVEDVNWTVEPGDYWVLAGLQGSGKSDFLMMAASLMAPVRGDYWLFGEPMPIFDEARLKTRLRVGLVFDGGQLFNHLTVRENIALPLRYHRNVGKLEAEQEAQPWLEALELAPWADTTPGAIGRNWQKRVGLARALILQPEVLLVDNPLGGLDLRHSNWWLDFLDQLAKGHPRLQNRPMTLIVSAANLQPWRGRARQFAVLRERRFSVLGTWPQLESAGAALLRELLPEEAAPVKEQKTSR